MTPWDGPADRYTRDSPAITETAQSTRLTGRPGRRESRRRGRHLEGGQPAEVPRHGWSPQVSEPEQPMDDLPEKLDTNVPHSARVWN